MISGVTDRLLNGTLVAAVPFQVQQHWVHLHQPALKTKSQHTEEHWLDQIHKHTQKHTHMLSVTLNDSLLDEVVIC